MHRAIVGTTILLFATSAAVARPVRADIEVDTCGQVVSGSAYLTADLDCSSSTDAPAVRMVGGQLDLRGFTLTTGYGIAVYCEKSCEVMSTASNGRLFSSGGYAGVIGGHVDGFVQRRVPVRVRDVAIAGFAYAIDARGSVSVESSTIAGSSSAILSGFGSVKISDSTITNSTGTAVFAARSLRMSDSGVVGCGQLCLDVYESIVLRDSIVSGGFIGIGYVRRAKIMGSTISDHGGDAVSYVSGKLMLSGSAITGNGGIGAFGQTTRVVGSVVSGNAGDGVVASSLRIADSVISGNGKNGIREGGCVPGDLQILRSTITGNGVDAGVCGLAETCADIRACTFPVLDAGTTCDTSYDAFSGFPGASWGVCALD